MSRTAIAELDVYSGQPNPQWVLSEKLLAELHNYLSHLSPASSSCAIPTQLGYRGIKINSSDSGALWGMYVGNGKILWDEAGKKSVLIDKQKTVERWLLESGRAYIDPLLYQYVLHLLLPTSF